MSSHPTVADVIARTLLDRGCTVAFGIPGVHNLPFWDSDEGLRIFGVRHEQAAVYAADGYFRATGKPAAALVTSGPGAANTAGAFGEAFMCGSAVIVIASEVNASARHADGPRGILHEMLDQAALFTAFGAPSWTAWNDADAVSFTTAAVDAALATPTGPTAVSVATDVLGSASGAAVPPRTDIGRTLASDAEIEDLVALLNAHEHVVLWIGGGALDAQDQIVALAERIKAPMVTTYASKGFAAGHPLVVDAPVHEDEVSALIASADLMLGLGSEFDGMNTRNWKMPVPKTLAAVCLGDQVARTFAWDLLLGAEVADAVTRVVAHDALDSKAAWCDPEAIRPALLARLQADPRTAPGIQFMETVHAAWPEDGVVVCDMAVSGFWYGGYAPQSRARRMQYPVGWGTLGFGLPAAMGPAAAGFTTLAVCGDGGPMFALGEFATMVQEGLPVTMLVNDDGGYGMLRFDQQTFGHPERGVDLFTPDWFHLGATFGIDVAEADTIDELGPLLAAAAASGKPNIVVHRNVFYPPKTTSPRWFE